MADGPTRTASEVVIGGGEWLCASSDILERGTAWLWEVTQYDQTVRAFALRFDGRVVAYLNRCLHVPTEMDWQPGQFLDMDKRWIICSIHGATYEPADGQCVGGPCGRGRLTPVEVRERDGQVYWYPSRDIRSLFDDAPPTQASTAQGNPHESA